MEVLLGLIVGLILGGSGIWLIMRSQIQGIKSQKQASDEKANLYHSHRDALSTENKDQEQKIESLNEEIRSILNKSSDADAKIARLSELQHDLKIKTNTIESLQSKITDQKERISRLTTNLENKEQYAKQRIDELNANLEQVNSEKNQYKDEIELANQRSAEANAQKEQIHELKHNLELKNRENQELQSQKNNLDKELASLKTQLQEEQKSTQKKLDLLRNTQQNLTDTFKALSADALDNNNQRFLEVAKATFENIYQSSQHTLEAKEQAIDNLVSPIKKSLEEFDKQMREIENNRQRDKGQISEKLESVTTAQLQLQAETANLSKALRQPIVRGRWGEMQLKRVVEMSGMQEHCDFTIQETVYTENGLLRPDLVVKLPGKKQVVVDSKAPLKAYLEAIEAQKESIQLEHLKNHAGHIRNHINQLSSRRW